MTGSPAPEETPAHEATSANVEPTPAPVADSSPMDSAPTHLQSPAAVEMQPPVAAEPAVESHPAPTKRRKSTHSSVTEESATDESHTELVAPGSADVPGTTPTGEPAAPPSNKKWYVIKVASGREESIKAAIERRMRIEALEPFFGQIVIPVERVTEVKKVKETKNGEKITKEKRVIKERKKYPGYLMAEVEFNEQILYLFRETNGVGDFVGASGPLKPPPPMTDAEVQRMLGLELSVKDGGKLDPRKTKVKVKIDIEKGDKVRLRDGAFAGTEGEVLGITEAKDDSDTPKITVRVQFWGRPVDIDSLEYWQVDKV